MGAVVTGKPAGARPNREGKQDVNVLQVIFAGLWKLTEDMPTARKMIVSVAEEYNRRMDEINGRR
jgi:hypothetical protein